MSIDFVKIFYFFQPWFVPETQTHPMSMSPRHGQINYPFKKYRQMLCNSDN